MQFPECGDSTGTIAFNSGCYELTFMPTDFHKIIDNILHKTQNSFTLIDDILIVTKWTPEHMTKVEEAIKMLDELGVRLKFEQDGNV